MPKIKTRKSVAKRFKITGSGKIFRRQTHHSHILVDKPSKRKKRLGKMVEVKPADKKRLIHLINL